MDAFFNTVGISMGTNGAPLLADLIFYSYEADFIQGLLKKNEMKLSRSLNFTLRYIDDVLSLNNFRLGDFSFSLGHCVLLRYTDSDYTFGIFKLFLARIVDEFDSTLPTFNW